MSTEFTPEVIKSLKYKVFQSARDGMAISIFAMLWNLDRNLVKEVLGHDTEENGQKTTPLIIAARNGEDKVVQVLLSNFNVDTEQTGTVKFDGYVIEGATSLWCAAGAGHYSVVKTLIDHGANVNKATVTNSTPLRAACFDGRLDIVKYLVEHNADLTIANKYNNTCLMISCYKGHREVVAYLLEKGANPDVKAHCGATALHFSAECGHLDIVKELIKYGGSLLNNDHKMTPLTVSAECGNSRVVDYLVSLPSCSTSEKIDALELLGASFANDKDNYDVQKCYRYLMTAMEERYKNPENIVKKPDFPPIPAYDNKKECQNVEDLKQIDGDQNAIHMEALTIRERILGPDNPELSHPVIFRGAVFADNTRFDRCIALWLHALKLRQRNKYSICKDLLRFSQVFSQMVHIGVDLPYENVKEVFQHAIIELDRDQKKIEKEESDTLMEYYQSNIHTCLYLLVIAVKVTKNDTESEELNKHVYKFIRLNPLLRNGYTPLHMAVDSATIVDDFHVIDVVSFPNASLASRLVKCGANINALDRQGNSPLHIIVRYANPISDFDTLHKIMVTLIKAGAHLDICNKERKTPVECTTTGVAEVILRTQAHLSLKCLAARAIQKNQVPFKGVIPVHLEDFVILH